MSVEYSSGIAEGWLFTQEEVDDFNEKTNYKYEDDFILIDSWTGDSDSIFGEGVMRNTEEGAANSPAHNTFGKMFSSNNEQSLSFIILLNSDII